MDAASLVEEHGPRVWALCRRLDPHPDDAYQEVWAKVFAAHFDPLGPASFATWIRTLTHRHLVDRHRRRVSRAAVLSDDDIHAEAFADVDTRGDTSRYNVATQQQLEAALALLPEAHRRVVLLHHVEDVPLDEIATVEGVPVGTVKSRLHRARTALARSLA